MQNTTENAPSGHIEYFLDIVARNYADNSSLSEFCFVFPNKRAGLYFRQSLRKVLADKMPYLEPEVTTISDFVASFSDNAPATRYELLFILYNAYKDVLTQKGRAQSITPFDKFAYWGEMLLNDFDEIDKNLVNAEQLFVNYERFKEIQSDYLTKEQKDVLNSYFGEDINTSKSVDNPDSFWQHTNGNIGKKFLALWEIINDIYRRFRECLADKHLSYQGIDYRDASKKVKNLGKDDFDFSRYIFVGFNVPSTSELVIFERLKDLELAEFCWDYNSPAFALKDNHACRFMEKNIKHFPATHDCNKPKITTMPKVRVIASASATGMVKSACQAIRKNISKFSKAKNDVEPKNKAAEAASRSALVLPDESMLIPVVDSISSSDSNANFPINITMGYPLRMTPIASLINDIARLHINTRVVKKDPTKPEYLFFYNDVATILASPIVRSFAAEDCDNVLREIRKYHIFNIPPTQFPESLKPIFTPIADLNNTKEVFDYLDSLTSMLADKIEVKNDKPSGINDDDDDETPHPYSLNEIFLNHYRAALSQLRAAVEKYQIQIDDISLLFRLIDRVVGNDTINFTGEPIGGLQILGILETRAINFSNIYILSMNEKVFPRQHFSNTFIPDFFRRAYKLPTIRDQESMSAYYFYRLISRADNVYLYYVSTTKGLKSGEMSRYITQLQYLFPDCVTATTLTSSVITADDKNISVKKTDDVLAELEPFKAAAADGKSKNITASSLKNYLNCRLSFYFNKVKGIRIKSEFTDYIDDPMLGTIVHKAFEIIYKSGQKYDSNSLSNLASSTVTIDKAIIKAVNLEYILKDENRCLDPLTGEAKIVAVNVKKYIVGILNTEAKMIQQGSLKPFTMIKHEEEIEGKITLDIGNGKPISFNVKQFIDRLDEYTDENDKRVVRVIDYKTGSDESSAKDKWQISILSNYKQRVIFQLFFYCEVLRQLRPKYNNAILQPLVYKVREMSIGKDVEPIKLDKTPITSYDDIRDKFRSILYDIVSEIFSKEKDGKELCFDQAAYGSDTAQFKPDDSCTLCDFNFICNKKINKTF